MEPNRRRLLALITSAGTVTLAGCGGGNGDGEGDGNGGDSDGDDGANDTSTDSDGGASGEDDSGTTATDGAGTSTDTDGAGTSTDGATDSDEELRPSDVTGAVQSSIDELEVVSHEVTGVDPQIAVDIELRNTGDRDQPLLAEHNFESKLFDAAGNDVLRELSGTRGSENEPSTGESAVVTVYLFPEEGAEPARYEITVNCDGVEYSGYTYCEGE